MSTLTYILIFSFLGSVASLIGGLLLLAKKGLADRISHYLSAFAAGVLLGAAFFDLLPEAIEEAGDPHVLGFAAAGVIIFFLMERFIHWFHHHHEHTDGKVTTKPVVPLVIFGDTFHNFIDGVAIGAAFLIDPRAGIITAMAAAAHEIPQEIGDFGILLKSGMPRGRVLWYNFLSALATIIGAVLVYFTGEAIKPLLPALLSLTAGFFIYISASDLIPEIHGDDHPGLAYTETILLIAGVVIVAIASNLLHI